MDANHKNQPDRQSPSPHSSLESICLSARLGTVVIAPISEYVLVQRTLIAEMTDKIMLQVHREDDTQRPALSPPLQVEGYPSLLN